MIFPDPSGRAEKFFPDPDDAEKLTGSLKKKNHGQLIKFTFLIFPDPSGCVEKFFPDPGNGLASFAAIGAKGRVFFYFEPLFQVWLLFWVPHPIFW